MSIEESYSCCSQLFQHQLDKSMFPRSHIFKNWLASCTHHSVTLALFAGSISAIILWSESNEDAKSSSRLLSP